MSSCGFMVCQLSTSKTAHRLGNKIDRDALTYQLAGFLNIIMVTSVKLFI